MRWTLDDDGGITWRVQEGDKAHDDHIEMSGRKISLILGYATRDDGALVLHRILVWPALRTIPNDTHASLAHDFGFEFFPKITIDGRPIGAEFPISFTLRGMLTVRSRTASGVEVRRTIFPSTTKPAAIENCTLTNTTSKPVTVEIGQIDTSHPSPSTFRTDPAKGVYGEYVLAAEVVGSGAFKLAPGESVEFSMVFTGRKAADAEIALDPMAEERARRDYVESLWEKLVFECPDPVLEREFAFAKVRAAESIFETKAGLMHSPGGGAYYAAIWANDQAEYANPFFPFLGDPAGNESALNSFRLFARYINPAYEPLPSSIIAEATDTWRGAGDRGDAAMVAYGAARFALASGDRGIAEELWPLVEWCLEYCRRRTNADGVVASDSDELEGRFPAGDANLCTSSLTCDALRSAAYLAASLGKPKSVTDDYNARADALHAAIEKHFGANVDGFDTYRYYAGNTVLRAWICIPLAMGIFDRAAGTIDALFSPGLWTPDGLATEAGKETFWDRSTLYALRGVLAAGDVERGLEHLQSYSRRRLLGEHVPYPVEAYPEGGQRHLSAESALYCRVITEGLFGIRPTGLRSFDITPRLPDGWDMMALRSMHAFGGVFDIVVGRSGSKLTVDLRCGGATVLEHTIKPGSTAQIVLPGC